MHLLIIMHTIFLLNCYRKGVIFDIDNTENTFLHKHFFLETSLTH